MSATTMASLFRPWAAVNEDSSQPEEIFLNKFPGKKPAELHQDSTVSTTSSSKPTPTPTPGAGKTAPPPPPSLKPDARCRKTTIHAAERQQKRRKANQDVRKTSAETVAKPEFNPANIGSGPTSAFSPKVPSRGPEINANPHEMHMDAGLLERLHAESHLGLLPGCSSGDYMSRYCYPESYDVIASELAMESALIHGIMPSPAQMEEYGRLLQLQEQSMKGATSRKQRPKKYRCPHCQVAFSNNGQLKGHIRIHTGERPFKCEDSSCGKTFTRNEELTRHKRIHSGLRPYACSSCGKRFGRKDHLKKHARTHQPQYHRQAMLVPFLPPIGHPYPYMYGI